MRKSTVGISSSTAKTESMGILMLEKGTEVYVGVFRGLLGMHRRCLSHMILNMCVFVERVGCQLGIK